MEYREKLSDLGIDTSKIRGSQGYTVCPKCSHTRKKKKDPCLSVNTENGAYCCHHCGWQGNVRFEGREKKEYTRPVFTNQTDCNQDVVNWFANRGISQMTLLKNQVKTGTTWIPQVNDNRVCIQFPYFRNNELINIKYRDHEKNFRLEKNAELIFYGLNDLKDDQEYIVIAEGEICKLSWNQAGVNFALSVPNGASKGQAPNLEYLDNCWEYFNNKKKIILATDNDEAGMILREALSKRLGKSRCFKIDFKDVKDANDYLIKYGPDELSKLIDRENLIEYPIRGVLDINDFWSGVVDYSKNGLSKGVVTGLYREFDNLMSFTGGKFCVVTGAPNSGKTPFIDQVAISLSINHGWKWAVVSMESKPIEMYASSLVEKIIGKPMKKGQDYGEIEMNMARRFFEEHIHFIEANPYNDEKDTLDFILSTIEDLASRKGINGFIIDPWNKIEHEYRKGENETNYVSRALDQIIRTCQKFDLFGFLIAHPTKLEKDKTGTYKAPTLYDVSGSSNFYNKPDWGITVHRNKLTSFTEVHVTKAKWRHLGELGQFTLKYNPVNGRLGESTQKLDFSNWITSLPFLKDMESKKEEKPSEENWEEIVETGQIPDDAPF